MCIDRVVTKQLDPSGWVPRKLQLHKYPVKKKEVNLKFYKLKVGHMGILPTKVLETLEHLHLLLLFVIALFHAPLVTTVSSCSSNIWSQSESSLTPLLNQRQMLFTYIEKVVMASLSSQLGEAMLGLFSLSCYQFMPPGTAPLHSIFSSFPRKEETDTLGPEYSSKHHCVMIGDDKWIIKLYVLFVLYSFLPRFWTTRELAQSCFFFLVAWLT